MSDLDLFRGLAKRVPLEPVCDAETYFKICDVQDELRDNDDPAVRLYLAALTLFAEAYDQGYRADEVTTA